LVLPIIKYDAIHFVNKKIIFIVDKMNSFGSTNFSSITNESTMKIYQKYRSLGMMFGGNKEVFK